MEGGQSGPCSQNRQWEGRFSPVSVLPCHCKTGQGMSQPELFPPSSWHSRSPHVPSWYLLSVLQLIITFEKKNKQF